MHISSEKLQDFNELLEDTIEYYCDQNIISGELAWILVQTLATAKIAELRNQLAAA